MSSLAALLAAAAATLPAPTPTAGGVGVRIESVQARATIVEAAVLRQTSGLETARDKPRPRGVRRGRIIQFEFQ